MSLKRATVIQSLCLKGFSGNRGYIYTYKLFYKNIFLQEATESFAFPARINSISTEILRKCSKLYFFSLESLEYSFLCFGLVLKEKCINQKAKPHKPSSVVGLQNGIWVLGLSCFVSEEFDNNNTPI